MDIIFSLLLLLNDIVFVFFLSFSNVFSSLFDVGGTFDLCDCLVFNFVSCVLKRIVESDKFLIHRCWPISFDCNELELNVNALDTVCDALELNVFAKDNIGVI